MTLSENRSSPNRCAAHPNYKGKKPPKRDCSDCRAHHRFWVDLRASKAFDDLCWHLGTGRWAQ